MSAIAIATVFPDVLDPKTLDAPDVDAEVCSCVTLHVVATRRREVRACV